MIRKLSILVPVYNEAATVEALLRRVAAVPFPVESEIIAVDDGSTDGSHEVLLRLEALGLIRAIVHSANQGKGAAVRSAAAHATGDVVVVQDADLELDPSELPSLLAPLISGESQVCYGSRFLKGVDRSMRRRPAYWANRLLNALCNRLNGLAITDFNTCYKMLSAAIIRRLELEQNGFALEPEITTKLARLGVAIVERPITYAPRSVAEGKKIRFADFFKYVAIMFRYRFFWSPAQVSMGDTSQLSNLALSAPKA